MSADCTYSQDYTNLLVISQCSEIAIVRSFFDHCEQGVNANGFQIATIRDTIFQNNFVTGSGGGCWLNGPEIVIASTCFQSCNASQFGGAMFLVSSSATACTAVMVAMCESQVSPFRLDLGTETVVHTNSTQNYATQNCAGLRLSPVGTSALAQYLTFRGNRNGGMGLLHLGNAEGVLEICFLRSNVIDNAGAHSVVINSQRAILRESVFKKNDLPMFSVISDIELVIEGNCFDFEDISGEPITFDLAANSMGYSGLPIRLSYAALVGRNCMLISNHNRHSMMPLRLPIFFAHLNID